MRCTHWSRQKDWSKVEDTFLIVIEKEIIQICTKERGSLFCTLFFFMEKLASSVHAIYTHDLAFKVI